MNGDVGAQMIDKPYPAGESLGPGRMKLTETLALERQRLVTRIAEIDELLTALRETPGVERVIDLIFKQGLR